MKASLAAMKQAAAYEQLAQEQAETKTALLRLETLMGEIKARLEAVEQKLDASVRTHREPEKAKVAR